MSPQSLPQYLQKYVVFLILFGKQIFSKTSELNYCGCCLFHSKKAIRYRRLPFFNHHALVVFLFKVIPDNVSFCLFGRDPIY